MAGLASPPGFGTNSWNQDYWARAQEAVLPRFAVADSAAWKPTPSTVSSRTVLIASGGGWTCGVWDQTSATETFTLDANTGNVDRWDFIVSRAIWGTTKTRAFAVIKGGSLPPSINSSSAVLADSVNRLPGTQYDGLVAMVRVQPGVNLLAASDVIDLRVWSNGSGVLSAATVNNQGYLDLDAGAVISQPTASGGLRVVQKITTSTWVELNNPAAPTTGSLSLATNYKAATVWGAPKWVRDNTRMSLQGSITNSPIKYDANQEIEYLIATLPAGTAPGDTKAFSIAFGNGASLVAGLIVVRTDGKVYLESSTDVHINAIGQLSVSLAGCGWYIGL